MSAFSYFDKQAQKRLHRKPKLNFDNSYYKVDTFCDPEKLFFTPEKCHKYQIFADQITLSTGFPLTI